MGRHEIIEGNIKVAYGYDQIAGYFLSVTDERLEWTTNVSNEVNEVCIECTITPPNIYRYTRSMACSKATDRGFQTSP